MTLGNKLSKLRKENNYTQEQLASILGVSRQAISKWESDITYPETDKLIRISELFDCSLDYLLKSEVKSDNNNNTQEIQENSNNMAVLVDSEKEKFSKVFMGILYLVIAILIFYFGGNIIESIFNIGKEFGKSIGNVFWG